jgi:predicted permease
MGEAEAEMNTLAAQIQLAFPPRDNRPTSQTPRVMLVPASPFGRPDPAATAGAVLILATVGLVLMIACANVASLLLARSAARQREIAIRLAIGASRRRIVRQLLTEYALLSILAGAAGVVLSWWSLRFLMAQIAATLPDYLTFALEIAPDYRVLAYATLLCIVATLASGLVPALRVSSPNLTSALKDEGSPFGELLRKSRLRDLMIGFQVAICLILLIAAGLMARTSQRALDVDLGFNYRNVLMLLVSSPAPTTDAAKLTANRTELAERLAGLPEIQMVSAASRVPLGGGLRTIAVSTNGAPLSDPATRSSFFNVVTPSYFATMGIAIVRGRNFTAQEARHTDSCDGSPVIVSEATARLFWPGQDPIGQRLAFGPGRDSIRFSGEGYPHSISSTVIGVAKDVRSVGLKSVDETSLYFPGTLGRGGAIILRARGDEGRALAAVQREFETLRNDLEGIVMDSRAAFTNQSGFVAARAGAIGSAIIGALGLLIAAVGIYGTVGFVVTQRTHEIGIRMALGAQCRDALGLVLTETMRPVAAGLAAGLAGAAVVSRLMSSHLFGLSSLDPIAFLGAAGFLAGVALLAGYLPARRVTCVDPMSALRCE